jgi:hypothetical protein
MTGWAERVEAAIVERLNDDEMVQPALVPLVGGSMATVSGFFFRFGTQTDFCTL